MRVFESTSRRFFKQFFLEVFRCIYGCPSKHFLTVFESTKRAFLNNFLEVLRSIYGDPSKPFLKVFKSTRRKVINNFVGNSWKNFLEVRYSFWPGFFKLFLDILRSFFGDTL